MRSSGYPKKIMKKPTVGKYPRVTEVTDSERIEMVKEIFATITGKYDFLNHFLSLRRDIAWRHFSVGKMRFFNTYRMLDVATGTADLAIAVAREHSCARIIGLDFVQQMIDFGRAKIEVKGLSHKVQMLRGDALYLPFPDSCFDVAAIAFGIRNTPNKIGAIKEMVRVVVPGGQVMVLEMTFPCKGPFRKLYHVYLNLILPRLARAFSPNPKAYHYLADSIMNFPTPDALARLMEKAGLMEVRKYSLTLGITHLHLGLKPGVPQP